MKVRALYIYAILYMVFLYLPILLIPLFSFNDSTLIVFPLKGFTVKWYQALFADESMQNALWNSLYVGFATAALSTALALVAARAIVRYRFPARRPILGIIMTPLFLPEIIVGISLLVVVLQLGFNLSLTAVIFGHTLVCVPYAMAILMSNFEGFDRSLEEASADLGETPVGTFFRVTLPNVAPGIVSSLLITFTISLDEFILAFFLTGTEPTLPIYIWGQLRFPAKLPNVLALGSLMLAASFLLLTIGELLRRRNVRRLANSETE